MTTGLYINNVHAAYGKKEVVRGVSLTVEPGEIVVLVGPNGAGKSTVLRVAAGFLAPTEGSVHFADQDITRVPPHERVALGLTSSLQGGRIFPSLTVKEHLELPKAGTGGASQVDAEAPMLDLFPSLRPLLRRRAGLLSGGERQALAISVALLCRPRVLLLDEPSAGLAPRLVRELLERVRQLSQTRGIGVLLVEQAVDEALEVADRAIALVAGRMVLETIRPKQWLASGALEDVFFAPCTPTRTP